MMKKTILFLLMFTAPVVSNCRAASIKLNDAIPFCDIVMHADRYDGKKIETTAILSAGYHSVIAYDSRCMPTESENISTEVLISNSVPPKHLLARLLKSFRHHKDMVVNFEATFHSTGGPFGADGAKFQIAVEKLKDVRAGKQTSP
jgi:hypothetical protein